MELQSSRLKKLKDKSKEFNRNARIKLPKGKLEGVINSLSESSNPRYPDDSRSPDRESWKEETYDGPRYPDDSRGPNATVYRDGNWIYCGNDRWFKEPDTSWPDGGA